MLNPRLYSACGRLVKAHSRHRSLARHSSTGIGTCNSQFTEVEFENGESTRFNNLFLRDSCASPESVEVHSKQKFRTTAEVSEQCQPNDLPRILEKDGEEVLEMSWFQGNGKTPHKSEYPIRFLQSYATEEGRRKGKFFDTKKTPWNLSILDQNLINFDYHEYLQDELVFYDLLKALNKYGIALINNIPEQKDNGDDQWYVGAIANRIGYVRETFYGKYFDVKSIPNAKNILYTSYPLPLHMDLLYYESPPGLQLLHSIKNKTNGGENVFADSLQLASCISELDPPLYMALKAVPIPYHYNNDDEYYYHRHPLIVEDETYTNLNGKQPIKEINYSPQFQAPFDCKEIIEYSSNYSTLKDFLRGFKLFENLINEPLNQFEIKLSENSCVIFDNRRVLHSRRLFEPSEKLEERWLKGCYIDTDTFMSRLRVYYSKYN